MDFLSSVLRIPQWVVTPALLGALEICALIRPRSTSPRTWAVRLCDRMYRPNWTDDFGFTLRFARRCRDVALAVRPSDLPKALALQERAVIRLKSACERKDVAPQFPLALFVGLLERAETLMQSNAAPKARDDVETALAINQTSGLAFPKSAAREGAGEVLDRLCDGMRSREDQGLVVRCLAVRLALLDVSETPRMRSRLRLRRAWAMYQSEDADCLAEVERILSDAAVPPDVRPDILMLRGWARLDAGLADRASEDFTWIIDNITGPSRWSFEGRGIARSRLGKRQEALEDLERASREGALMSHGYLVLGDAYYEGGRFPEAYAAYIKEGGEGGTYGCARVRIAEGDVLAKSDSSRALTSYREAETLVASILRVARSGRTAPPAYHRLMADVQSRIGNSIAAESHRRAASRLESQADVRLSWEQHLRSAWQIVEAAYRQAEAPGDLDQAIAAANNVLEERPNDVEGRYALGLAKLKLGDLTETVAVMNDVLKQEPDRAGAYLFRGWAFAGQASWLDARSDAQKALQRDPSLFDAYRLAAVANSNLGDLNEALAALQVAVSTDPTSSESHRDLVQTLGVMSRWNDVVAAGSAAGLAGVADSTIQGVVGEAHRRLGQLDDAIAACSLGIQKNPDGHLCYLVRGAAFLAKGQSIKARADLDLAVKLRPEDSGCRIWRAAVRSALGLGEDALEDMDHTVRADPHNAEAYKHRGLLCLRRTPGRRSTEELRSADQDLRKAIELSPKDAETRAYRAECLRLLGKPQKALQSLAESELLDSNLALAMLVRAWVYFDQQDWTKARAQFGRALQLGGEATWLVYYGLAECSRLLGDAREAIRLYDLSEGHGSAEWCLFNGRGWARRDEGDWEGAAKEFTRGLDAYDLSPADRSRLLQGRAEARFCARQDGLCVEDIERAAELAPDSWEVVDEWASYLGQMGQWVSAIDLFTKEIEMPAGRARGLANRGWARIMSGDAAGGEQDLTLSLGLAPQDAVSWGNRGWARLRQQSWPAALEDLSRSLELDRNLHWSLGDRAIVQAELGQDLGAREDLQALVENRLKEMIGSRPVRRRRDELPWGATVADWNACVERASGQPLRIYGRAIVEWMAGRLEEAQRDVEAAQDLDATLPGIQRVRDLVRGEMSTR